LRLAHSDLLLYQVAAVAKDLLKLLTGPWPPRRRGRHPHAAKFSLLFSRQLVLEANAQAEKRHLYSGAEPPPHIRRQSRSRTNEGLLGQRQVMGRQKAATA